MGTSLHSPSLKSQKYVGGYAREIKFIAQLEPDPTLHDDGLGLVCETNNYYQCHIKIVSSN